MERTVIEDDLLGKKFLHWFYEINSTTCNKTKWYISNNNPTSLKENLKIKFSREMF